MVTRTTLGRGGEEKTAEQSQEASVAALGYCSWGGQTEWVIEISPQLSSPAPSQKTSIYNKVRKIPC